MKLGMAGASLRNMIRYLMAGFILVMVAACGGGGGSPGTVSGTSGTGVGSVSLIFSSPELKSSGAAGSEVTITALVKNAQNNAMEGIDVKFSADSGALTGVSAKTDKNGQAKASLGTSGDRTNRTITVTVQAGTKSTTGTVKVVDTKVASAGPSSIAAGSTGEFTITVRDSDGAAVANVPISYSSQRGNPVAVKSSGGGTAAAPLTDTKGQVVLLLTASQSGNDVLTVSSQGASATSSFIVSSSSFTVKAVEQADTTNTPVSLANTASCLKIISTYQVNGVGQSGTLNLTTSRGRIYVDSGCSTELTSGAISISGGSGQAAYLRSDTTGVATVTGTVSGGPSAQTEVRFTVALTPFATISVQAEPGVIGTRQTSTITAIVRDGTSNNNLVEFAEVEFSIVNDRSGGSLSNPSTVKTGSNGAGFVTYTAGDADTPTNGVSIQAKIKGTNTVATTNLTVSRKSLFITAGTGNSLEAPTSTTYKQDFAVFVTDASGNPVKDVDVTASVIPVSFRKGGYVYVTSTSGSGWIFDDPLYTCGNEDTNRNGILDTNPNEDVNNNGVLEPRIPMTVTASGKTDASGMATISLLYPKDRARWTDVQVTVRATVSGTEAAYTTAAYMLPGLASDFSSATTTPPGQPSPYGVNPCTSSN